MASKPTRLATVMELLGTNASVLSRHSGADHSLISKWQKGARPLSGRSKQLAPVAGALLALDTEGRLRPELAPYRQRGESAAEALCTYLTGADLPALPPRAAPPSLPTSGEYTVQYRVFLGQRGFRQAALATLDYILTLPPDRELLVLCDGRHEWYGNDPGLLRQFVTRLHKVFARGTRITVVNRKGYSIAESQALAWPWLLAHLRGQVRSGYYEGTLPESVRFVGSIHDFWSSRVEDDNTVEDSLYTAMHANPRDFARDQALCEEYLATSCPAMQYGFLAAPEGAGGVKLWGDGPLPGWNAAAPPDGSFCAVCRVPTFGLISRAEYAAIEGGDSPALPEYLFSEGGYTEGPHRVILCREDVREGLQKQRRQNEALSALLHRRAFVTRAQLRAQLGRMVAAMEQRGDFEVALVPRVAFERLQMELVCWRGSVSVGWLQDGSASVFANDQATSGAFYGSIGYVWNRLLAGWKRRDKVCRQLRKWLAAKELERSEPDSAIVRGWSIYPKDTP